MERNMHAFVIFRPYTQILVQSIRIEKGCMHICFGLHWRTSVPRPLFCSLTEFLKMPRTVVVLFFNTMFGAGNRSLQLQPVNAVIGTNSWCEHKTIILAMWRSCSKFAFVECEFQLPKFVEFECECCLIKVYFITRNATHWFMSIKWMSQYSN